MKANEEVRSQYEKVLLLADILGVHTLSVSIWGKLLMKKRAECQRAAANNYKLRLKVLIFFMF